MDKDHVESTTTESRGRMAEIDEIAEVTYSKINEEVSHNYPHKTTSSDHTSHAEANNRSVAEIVYDRLD